MTRLTPRRALLVSAGILSVGLGAVGVFVPLLPTTPFLLLAAACFARSSDRLHRWLVTHHRLGPYLTNYRDHRAMTARAKLAVLSLLWGSLGYAILWVVETRAARGLLMLVGAGVTLHILSLRTLRPGRPVEKLGAQDHNPGHRAICRSAKRPP